VARGWWVVTGGLWMVAVGMARPNLAQAPLPGPVFVGTAPGAEQDSTPRARIPKSYWLEGARVGALSAGLVLAFEAGAWCRFDSETGHCAGAYIGGAMLGALAGYGAGASLGSLIPNDERVLP